MAIPLATYLEMQRRQEAYQRQQQQQRAPLAATGIAGGGSQAFQQALQAPQAATGSAYSSTSFSAPGGVSYADDPRIAPIIAALGAQATISDADVRARTTQGLEGARNLANMNIDKMSMRNAASRGLSGTDGVSDQYRAEISAPIYAALAAEEGRSSLQGYDQRAGVGMGLLGSLNSSQNARNQLAMQQQQFEFQRQQAEQQRQQQMALQQQIASQAGRPMGPSLNDAPGWSGGNNTFLNPPGGAATGGSAFNGMSTNADRAAADQADAGRFPMPAAGGGATGAATGGAPVAGNNRPANDARGAATQAAGANRPMNAGGGGNVAGEALGAIRSATEGYNPGFSGGGAQPATGWTVGMPQGSPAGGGYNAGQHAYTAASNAAMAANPLFQGYGNSMY